MYLRLETIDSMDTVAPSESCNENVGAISWLVVSGKSVAELQDDRTNPAPQIARITLIPRVFAILRIGG